MIGFCVRVLGGSTAAREEPPNPAGALEAPAGIRGLYMAALLANSDAIAGIL